MWKRGILLNGKEQIVNNLNNVREMKMILNPYKIKHCICRAVGGGFVTMKDQEKLGVVRPTPYQRTVYFTFPALKRARGKSFSKQLEVLVITDVQFGRMDSNIYRKNRWKAAMDVATTKQKKEIIFI